MRVLGIDYGSKRVGVALGDTETRIASPWAVISDVDRLELLRKIHEFATNERAEAIVVGVPKPMRNREQENDQVKEIRGFIADLAAQGIVVHEEDETLSSGRRTPSASSGGEGEAR
jgi:putative Holliday junction resolvase